MEISKEDKQNFGKIIKFFDSVSKSFEGLKDKYEYLILEAETKNENLEPIFNNWVNEANLILKEKFEEIFKSKHTDESFRSLLKTSINKYKDNFDFKMNAKVLFNNLQYLRNTIKSKIIVNDTLSYTNLTDILISSTNTK